MQSRAFNTEEAAKYIGMSNEFLRRSRVKGYVNPECTAPKFIKIGRAVRYLKDDLDEWLNNLTKYEHLTGALE